MINRGIAAWPPSEMQAMSLDEFSEWYEIAIHNIQEKNAAIEAANKANQ